MGFDASLDIATGARFKAAATLLSNSWIPNEGASNLDYMQGHETGIQSCLRILYHSLVQQ